MLSVSKAVFHALASSRSMKTVASKYGMRRERSFARRFVAGETVPEAIAAARRIEQSGMTQTLDYLGESVATMAEADAAIVFFMPGAIPWLRTSRALVRVLPSGHRDQPSAATTLAAGTGVRTLDEPNRSTADNALDLVRMDDDGGWQMPRPPA